MATKKTVVRSAGSGRYVKAGVAVLDPNGTVTETVDEDKKVIRRLKRLLKEAYKTVPVANVRLLTQIEKALGI